jgi:peptide/nickel transport system permease protein
MLKYIARRFVNYLVLVFVATSMAYLLASATLSPISRYLATGRRIDLNSVHANLRSYNMDPGTPIWTRYWRWLNGILVHGNFGKVFPGDEQVTTEMARRIGVSLRLLLVGTILAVVFGVILGVYSALRQYKISDHVLTFVSFVLLSTPVFLLATLIKFGAIKFNGAVGSVWFPTSDEYDPGQAGDILARLQHLMLPTLVLVLGPAGAAFFSRYQRSAMLDVLGSDFLRTAQAKGLTKRKAFYKHGLRTALIPMATFFAFTFGLLITGATFTEIIFNWHGMGQWTVQTIQSSDINGVAAITGFVAVMVLVSSLLSDIFYALLDPRVRIN